MSGSEENPDIPLNPLCTARYLGDNKGYGVVAIQDINEGAAILKDIAAVTIDNDDTLAMAAQQDINRQYAEMSAEDQARFDNLHFFMSEQNQLYVDEQSSLKPTEELRAEFVTNFEHALIFATNCFDVGTSLTQASLFFNASRFNHACLPSAEYNVFQGQSIGNRPAPVRWEAYARRDIKAGEEITIAYNYRQFERERRQQDLLAVWGFPCGCDVCDLDGDDQGAKSREFDANLRNLYTDDDFWARTLWVSRSWDREQLDTHVGRLEERIGLCRAVGNQGMLWKSLEIISKFYAALWFNTKEDAYLAKWKTYTNEARYGMAHRGMEPSEIGGDWDKMAADDLERGEPDADQVWTESEDGEPDSDRESDEWVID